MIPSAEEAAHRIVSEIQKRQSDVGRPYLIAIDGGSGSGKSTVALLVAAELDAAYVPGDDFFAADITNAGWEQRSQIARATDAIDWRRLRKDVLEPLLARNRARWQAFDFVAGVRSDGTYGLLNTHTELEPADFIVLDGAYSARPELADLIDFSVLVDVSVQERHKRLDSREERSFLNAWHERWDEAELHYFTKVCPPSRFDMVIRNDASIN